MLWQRKEVQRIVGAVTRPPPAYFPVFTSYYVATGDRNVGSGNHEINCTGDKRFGLVDEGYRVLERNATTYGRGIPGFVIHTIHGISFRGLSVATTDMA
jgi:hypothetical protein